MFDPRPTVNQYTKDIAKGFLIYVLGIVAICAALILGVKAIGPIAIPLIVASMFILVPAFIVFCTKTSS